MDVERQPSLHAVSAIVQLLNAQSAIDECAACASLLRECENSDQLVLLMVAQPSVSPSVPDSASMLEEFLLFFMPRAFAKAPGGGAKVTSNASSDVVARWSPCEAPGGDELIAHLTILNRYSTSLLVYMLPAS